MTYRGQKSSGNSGNLDSTHFGWKCGNLIQERCNLGLTLFIQLCQRDGVKDGARTCSLMNKYKGDEEEMK